MTNTADLAAAMDVSGDPRTGNHMFLGIVLGTQDKINSIIRNTGHSGFHMRSVKNSRIQKHIISSISFDGKETAAFCMRIDKNNTVNELIRRAAAKNRPFLKKKIHVTYNRSVMRCIRQDLEGFLIKHDHSIHDVVFECDNDCLGIAKDNGLRHGAVANAYRLADMVAWANNRDMGPEGPVSADLSIAIKEMSYKQL